VARAPLEVTRERPEVKVRPRFGARGSAVDRPGEAGRGEWGSLTKTNGEDSLSRWSRRRARISSPINGWVLGEPFLTRRTCSTAALDSAWSHRRSHRCGYCVSNPT
jgi:hypothetical protein